MIQIVIDRSQMTGSVDFIGEAGHLYSTEEGAHELHERESRPDLAPHPQLPDDTRLWAALQQASGGTWGGCVYDVESVLRSIHGVYEQHVPDVDLEDGVGSA
jgi:xylonate dehydratase